MVTYSFLLLPRREAVCLAVNNFSSCAKYFVAKVCSVLYTCNLQGWI